MAEHERIDFDVDAAVRAEGLENQTAVAVCLRLFLGELLGVDKLLDE